MSRSHHALFEAVGALAPSREDTLARLDALATLLDSAIVIPGTRFRFGLDAVIGLVPVVGDVVSALISSYIIWEGKRLGLPRWKIARMTANVAFDTAIGIVPFLGDLADAAFKSNRRNVRIIREHLEKEAGRGVIEAEYRVVR